LPGRGPRADDGLEALLRNPEQLRALLGKVLDRIETVESDGEPRWMASHFVSGVKHLPITYRLR
jgi:hypothetical protein